MQSDEEAEAFDKIVLLIKKLTNTLHDKWVTNNVLGLNEGISLVVIHVSPVHLIHIAAAKAMNAFPSPFVLHKDCNYSHAHKYGFDDEDISLLQEILIANSVNPDEALCSSNAITSTKGTDGLIWGVPGEAHNAAMQHIQSAMTLLSRSQSGLTMDGWTRHTP